MPRIDSPAISRFLAIAAASFVAALFVAAPALAISADGPTAMIVAQSLCFEDCSNLPSVTHPDGTPFDFEFGAKIVQDGTNVDIHTTGNVYLVGPINASTEIRLFAGEDFTGMGSASLNAPSIYLDAGGADFNPKGVVVPPIVPGLRPIPTLPEFPLICACTSVVGHAEISVLTADEIVVGEGGRIRLGRGGRIEVAALTSLEPGEAPNDGGDTTDHSFYTVTREGDIYLDLSMVELGKLKVHAGKSIVVADAGGYVVPEPGTALLLGGGLMALAFRRRA